MKSAINSDQPYDYEILKDHWKKCLVCQKNLENIKKDFGGENKYFSQAFLWHIKQHNIDTAEYFEKIVGLTRPICKCGVCNQYVNISTKSAKIVWKEYKCGLYEGTKKWAEKAKESRKGKGNPMFGKRAWNYGLDITHPTIAKCAERFRGKKLSPEHIAKLKAFQSTRSKNPHLGHRHNKENCEKIRQRTIQMLKDGIFGKNKSKCHISMSIILDELNLKYKEEEGHGHFLFDFYLIDHDIYIEVDGDYWHSNPKFYPNGPKTKAQKINRSRDISKNKYCQKNKLKMIRFWENDIHKNKQNVIEKLKWHLNQ